MDNFHQKSFGLKNRLVKKICVKQKFLQKEMGPKNWVKIGPVTADIFLIWTNVIRKNLPGQMSLWQLVYVKDGPRNLPLKFDQNRVSNSWDIADIECVWWLGGVGGGVVFKSFSCQTQLMLRLRCAWVGVVTILITIWLWCCVYQGEARQPYLDHPAWDNSAWYISVHSVAVCEEEQNSIHNYCRDQSWYSAGLT